MTVEDLRSLPPTLDVPTAARLFGIGRTAAYQAIRAGTWPTPVLRPSARIMRIPTASVLELLGLGERHHEHEVQESQR
jgi:predicted DNA-binding transcriptional regulator AlpA